MNDTLDSIERLVEVGQPNLILELATPGEAEKMAATMLAADAELRKEFDNNPALLASYMRSLARGQERDAARALREPRTAPRLSMNPTAAAALHHQCATEPRQAPPTPAAQPVAMRASVTPAASHVPTPSAVALSTSARPSPLRGKVKLCSPGREPTPCERSLAAQMPERFIL